MLSLKPMAKFLASLSNKAGAKSPIGQRARSCAVLAARSRRHDQSVRASATAAQGRSSVPSPYRRCTVGIKVEHRRAPGHARPVVAGRRSRRFRPVPALRREGPEGSALP